MLNSMVEFCYLWTMVPCALCRIFFEFALDFFVTCTQDLTTFFIRRKLFIFQQECFRKSFRIKIQMRLWDEFYPNVHCAFRGQHRKNFDRSRFFITNFLLLQLDGHQISMTKLLFWRKNYDFFFVAHVV